MLRAGLDGEGMLVGFSARRAAKAILYDCSAGGTDGSCWNLWGIDENLPYRIPVITRQPAFDQEPNPLLRQTMVDQERGELHLEAAIALESRRRHRQARSIAGAAHESRLRLSPPTVKPAQAVEALCRARENLANHRGVVILHVTRLSTAAHRVYQRPNTRARSDDSDSLVTR